MLGVHHGTWALPPLDAGLVIGGEWDPSCPTKDGARAPCTGRQMLNHWTTRKVPDLIF